MGSLLPMHPHRLWHGALLATICVLAALPSSASAGSYQTVTLQDDEAFGESWDGAPAANMDTAKSLGVDGIRVFAHWILEAPNRDSCTVPNVDLSKKESYACTD